MGCMKMLSLALAVLAILATATAIEVGCDTLGTLYNPAKSCLHLRHNKTGSVSPFGDGIFFVRPAGSNGVPFPVFCDMHTDGGGWTLVAVVANGDDEHWTYDDRHGNAGQRTSHWEGRTTIGELTYRTPFANEDYKSKAYYTVSGNEVLITYKGENLARTASCLGGHTLRSLFNTYPFSCSGGSYNCYLGSNKCLAAGGNNPSSFCTHVCPIAEQYGTDTDSDGQGIAASGERNLFLKTGEANGAQDSNKDRTYFSFEKARTNVDYPHGLGSFSHVSGTKSSHDIGIHNDASVRPSDKSRVYGIFVR